jgi:hypothetical protein
MHHVGRRRETVSHFNDARALVNECRSALPKIETAYERSLNSQNVEPQLLIEIKNYMENLRSALDFSAHGLFLKYGDRSKKTPRICFPYARDGMDQAEFRSKGLIKEKSPGLSASHPGLAQLPQLGQNRSRKSLYIPKTIGKVFTTCRSFLVAAAA